jgi:hypothetical protein
VALQGTLDTFALPDVLRLLASTKKTGRLVIAGARGNGSVWVDTGAVVGVEASSSTGNADWVGVLFELLRFGGDGSFTFEAGTTAAQPAPARPVEPLLVDAERQLAEWREIEAVVPSLESWVSLVGELPGDDITITTDLWKRVVAIGSGTTVGSVARALELGELDVCRGIKDLVERGLVEVGAGTLPASRPVQPESPAAAGSGNSWDPFSIDIPGVAPLTPAADAEPSTNGEPIVVTTEPKIEESVRVLSVVADVADEPADDTVDMSGDDDEEADADEVAKQLASLSPKAARAVAAAAKATSEQERDAALAEARDDEDEPINRGLLLKFLSSVKS